MAFPFRRWRVLYQLWSDGCRVLRGYHEWSIEHTAVLQHREEQDHSIAYQYPDGQFVQELFLQESHVSTMFRVVRPNRIRVERRERRTTLVHMDHLPVDQVHRSQ